MQISQSGSNLIICIILDTQNWNWTKQISKSQRKLLVAL